MTPNSFLPTRPDCAKAFWVGSDGIERWSAVPGGEPKIHPVCPDDAIRRLTEDTRAAQKLGCKERIEGFRGYVCGHA